MNTEDVKNKMGEAMEEVKQKINKLVTDDRVHNVRTTITKCLLDVKSWVVLNWKSSGWQGKSKVIGACIVAFFFCRGIFCGWGTSRLEKELIAQKELQAESEAAHEKALHEAKDDKELREAEAAAKLLGAMMGGGGYRDEGAAYSTHSSSRPSGPEKKLWICQQCGNQVHSVVQPPRTLCRMYNGHGERDGSSYKHCRWRVQY